jgi:flagellar biosynthetic protein FliR
MINIVELIAAAFMVGMRITGLLLFAPVLGNQSVPVNIKAMLALGLTALLYPAVARGHAQLQWTQLPQMAISELLIGLLLGLSINCVFDALQLAGHSLGVQMGFSLASLIDPQTQADTPVLSVFYQTMALLIFLRLDVHFWLLRGLARSFEYLPPGSATLHGAAAELMLRQASAIWFCGVQIAAPVLAATMIADFVLAFVGRASPQLPVMFIGLSVKTVLGLFVAIATISLWPGMLERYYAQALATGERALHLVR